MEERRVSGRRVDDFPPLRRTRWDFSRVVDGRVYLLRKGRDFEVEVESLVIAARRWARVHGYRLTTRSEFDERKRGRPQVGLYVQFERKGGPPPAAGRRLEVMPLTYARGVDSSDTCFAWDVRTRGEPSGTGAARSGRKRIALTARCRISREAAAAVGLPSRASRQREGHGGSLVCRPAARLGSRCFECRAVRDASSPAWPSPAREDSMPTYILLVDWTDQGVRNFKDTVDRYEAAEGAFESLGVRFTDIRWTLGTHDMVTTAEAPDDETLAAALLSVAGQGNIRTTTLRAFTREEMRTVIGKAG
jgi:uncharacterized protein with GYD domain